jgi:predicted enzyme related to lactoylglutathione lyase
MSHNTILIKDFAVSHPIHNQIGAVFIPVSDMERSIAWYSCLFDLPLHDTSHEGRIYDVPMQGTRLILDSHKPVDQNSVQPLCLFWTDDIATAYEYLEQNGVPILSSVQDIGSVSFLLFEDPDHNRLMICQKNG